MLQCYVNQRSLVSMGWSHLGLTTRFSLKAEGLVLVQLHVPGLVTDSGHLINSPQRNVGDEHLGIFSVWPLKHSRGLLICKIWFLL